MEDVTVIIRTVKERTFPLCYKLLASEVDRQNISIVSEVPFLKSLKRTYEIGIDCCKKWTFVVDADVLVRKKAIEYLLKVAKCVDKDVFVIKMPVLDKLTGGPRFAGNHLYRTSHLKKAIRNIPNDVSTVRPESHTIGEMKLKGFPLLGLDMVIGLHDYEQFFCDIYRKAFFHTHKHGSDLIYWETMWRNFSNCEDDFKVALKGAKDGKAYDASVFSDIRQFYSIKIEKILNELYLTEKPILPSNFWSQREVDNIVECFFPSYEYWAYRTNAWNKNTKYLAQEKNLWEKMNSLIKNRGIKNAILRVFGYALTRSGIKLKNLSQ